jgi:predicted membrane-bound spermidine synthase
VEIDPAIVALGRARHPNRPYSSDKVRVSIDDARAFFRKDGGSYDLIWFGLLDSHTTPSAYANVLLGAIFAMILLANLLASRAAVPVTGWPPRPTPFAWSWVAGSWPSRSSSRG